MCMLSMKLAHKENMYMCTPVRPLPQAMRHHKWQKNISYMYNHVYSHTPSLLTVTTTNVSITSSTLVVEYDSIPIPTVSHTETGNTFHACTLVYSAVCVISHLSYSNSSGRMYLMTSITSDNNVCNLLTYMYMYC